MEVVVENYFLTHIKLIKTFLLQLCINILSYFLSLSLIDDKAPAYIFYYTNERFNAVGPIALSFNLLPLQKTSRFNCFNFLTVLEGQFFHSELFSYKY
jgi:hypothetical protein